MLGIVFPGHSAVDEQRVRLRWGCRCQGLKLRSRPFLTGHYESGNSFQFIGVQPGPVGPADVDDHPRSLAEVASRHQFLTFRARPVLHLLGERVASHTPHRGQLIPAGFTVAPSVDGLVDQHIEVLLRYPQAMALWTFVDTDAANAVGRHFTFAGRAGEFTTLEVDLMRAKFDSAGGAKTRIFGIPAEAFRADQAQLAFVPDDGGIAVVTVIGCFTYCRATGSTAQDIRVHALKPTILDGVPAMALEFLRRHLGGVELGVAFGTGNEMQGFKLPSMEPRVVYLSLSVSVVAEILSLQPRRKQFG